MTDTVNIPTNTNYLDEQITLCLHRDYFDLKEVQNVIDTLDAQGIGVFDITGPVVDWTRDRNYCDSTKWMNALLDVRNIIAPYPPAVEAETEETTDE